MLAESHTLMDTNNSVQFNYNPFITTNIDSPSSSTINSSSAFGSLLDNDQLKMMLLNSNANNQNVARNSPLTNGNHHHHHQQVGLKCDPQQHSTAANDLALEYQKLFEMVKPFIAKSTDPLNPKVMFEYLENPDAYDCVLQIFHARVAQKSYGTEKRFFCPPPCVYLSGGGWARKRNQFRELLQTANPHLATITPPANRYAELQKADPRVHIGIQSLREDPSNNGSESIIQYTNEPIELDFTNGKDYAPAKTLYISDSEKTKFFKLYVQISFMSGQEIGTFLSERIKVISKPSKKKQQMKNNECSYLCITSGKKIALFNRLRSQTVSTRYLHVDSCEKKKTFQASPKKWSAFTIYLVDEENSPAETEHSTEFYTKDGYIYYGAVVRLVDTATGLSLPRLRVRKVDKSNIICDALTNDEPVSQLHKCAFQSLEDGSLYLSLSTDHIVMHKAEYANHNQQLVGDSAAWTIISTEKVEYRYYEAMGPTLLPVTPAPLLEHINFDSDMPANLECDVLTLALNGRDFNPELKVWFATHQCKTTYRSTEVLECDVPRIEHFLSSHPDVLRVCGEKDGTLEVPVSLVRDDGVIYYTGMTFTYIGVGGKLAQRSR